MYVKCRQKKAGFSGLGFRHWLMSLCSVQHTSLVELGRGLRVGALGRSIGLLGRKRIDFGGWSTRWGNGSASWVGSIDAIADPDKGFIGLSGIDGSGRRRARFGWTIGVAGLAWPVRRHWPMEGRRIEPCVDGHRLQPVSATNRSSQAPERITSESSRAALPHQGQQGVARSNLASRSGCVGSASMEGSFFGRIRWIRTRALSIWTLRQRLDRMP